MTTALRSYEQNAAYGDSAWMDPTSTDTRAQDTARENTFASATAAADERQPFVDLSNLPNLRRLAQLPVDLVLEGETGSGKDEAARCIHRLGYAGHPFVSVNCAAMPDALIESEFFGVEAGAYTGAVRARPGKIEAADNGVLYLDEIDSMGLQLQAKLLQALETRGAVRLGGHKFHKSRFRLVVSTKVPLQTLVERGQFRADLFYRVNAVTLRLPPLREQPERILPTFTRMVRFHAQRLQVDERTLIPLGEAQSRFLLAHLWQGNYRELLNCAVRYVCGESLIDSAHPAGTWRAPAPWNAPCASHPSTAARQPELARDAQAPIPLRARINEFERELIARTVRAAGGNVARAASQLLIPVQTLHYRIRALDLREVIASARP